MMVLGVMLMTTMGLSPSPTASRMVMELFGNNIESFSEAMSTPPPSSASVPAWS